MLDTACTKVESNRFYKHVDAALHVKAVGAWQRAGWYDVGHRSKLASVTMVFYDVDKYGRGADVS